MALNFPANPSVGQVYNTGLKTWKWSGNAWTTLGVGEGTVIATSETPPLNPSIGDLWFNDNTAVLSVFYGDGNTDQWVTVSTSSNAEGGGANVVSQETAPADPSAGDLWFNTNTAVLYIYYADNTTLQWVTVTPSIASIGSGASVTTSETVPSTPADGDLWFNTGDGNLYVYYVEDGGSSQWVSTVATAADASAVSYTPAGIGAQVTTVQTKLRETVSVKDFGAVGDGVTDDTVAIQAALDAAEGAHTSLYFPAGVYICSNELTYSSTSDFSLRIYGDGAYQTGLKFTGATNGLVITYNEWRDGVLDIENIGIYAASSTALWALRVSATSYVSSASNKGCYVSNIAIGHEPSLAAATNYWSSGGIYFDNMPHTQVTSSWIRGYNAGTSGVGIYLGDKCISPIIDGCNLYTWLKGVHAVGEDVEGMHIQNNNFINNYDGLYIDASGTTSGTEVGLQINCNSLDNDHYNIYLNGRNKSVIANNDMYRKQSDTLGFTDVYMTDCTYSVVSNNVMSRDGGGANPATAIYLDNSDSTVITGNQVRTRDTGLYIDLDTTRVTCFGNDFDGVTTEIDDNTVTASRDLLVKANKKAMDSSHTLVRMNAGGLTTANNTDVTVNNWVKFEEHGGGDFDATGTARITVPDGVNKVVLKAQIQFASNATGYRSAWIEKNDSNNYPGIPWVRIPAVDTVSSIINLVSPPITVVNNDYFEVHVRHTAGGDLDLSQGTSCWFSMEVVA